MFTVLPLGLLTACYLFAKLMRLLIRLWRGQGLKAIVYLDDGIVAVPGLHEACRESMLVKRDLEKAGFVLNVEKSTWTPFGNGLGLSLTYQRQILHPGI